MLIYFNCIDDDQTDKYGFKMSVQKLYEEILNLRQLSMMSLPSSFLKGTFCWMKLDEWNDKHKQKKKKKSKCWIAYKQIV